MGKQALVSFYGAQISDSRYFAEKLTRACLSVIDSKLYYYLYLKLERNDLKFIKTVF